MKTIMYFSYGSNMSSRRLHDRVPSATFITIAKLKGHRLKFHKESKDGSGKCDTKHTSNTDHCVVGVVFEISASEKGALDRKEGLGSGYEEKNVKVVLENGDLIEALTYYATKTDASLKPYDWYKEHVLIGAREYNLPADYISSIEKTESIPDPKKERHAREMALYL